MQISTQLEIDAGPMLLAKLFGDNPFILSAGGQGFVDFVRVGVPLA